MSDWPYDEGMNVHVLMSSHVLQTNAPNITARVACPEHRLLWKPFIFKSHFEIYLQVTIQSYSSQYETKCLKSSTEGNGGHLRCTCLACRCSHPQGQGGPLNKPTLVECTGLFLSIEFRPRCLNSFSEFCFSTNIENNIKVFPSKLPFWNNHIEHEFQAELSLGS